MKHSCPGILIGAALLVATVASPAPGFGAPVPQDSQRVVGPELSRLADLSHALKRALHEEEHRLGTSCDFAGARDRLLHLQNAGLAALRRLGSLWREGRLRDGGFALSEVLVYDFAALINETLSDIAFADTLVSMQMLGHDAPEAREFAARIAPVLPGAAACVTRAGNGLTLGGPLAK